MASCGGYGGSYNSGGGGRIVFVLLLFCAEISVAEEARIFERIAAEASRLAHYSKRPTITTSREIQTAVRPLLPGELTKVPRLAHYNKKSTITFAEIQTAAGQHAAAAAMPKGSGLTKLMKLSRPRRQATPYPRDVSFEYLSSKSNMRKSWLYFQCFLFDYSCVPPCWRNLCAEEELLRTTPATPAPASTTEKIAKLKEDKEEEEEEDLPAWAVVLLSLLGLLLMGGGAWLLYYVSLTFLSPKQ